MQRGDTQKDIRTYRQIGRKRQRQRQIIEADFTASNVELCPLLEKSGSDR